MNGTQWAQTDRERLAAVERAITVSSDGSTLLQTFINRTVQQLTLRELGLQAVLPRRPGTGDAARINRRSASSTGAEWVSDTATVADDEGSYAQATFTYRTLLTSIQITRKIQATGRSYADVMATELTGKSEDFANALDSGLIVGDNNANAQQIDGFLTLVGAVGTQVVAQTSAAAGDDLTLASLDQAIDLVKGSAAREDLVIVGSFNGLRKVNAALQAQQRFNDMTEIAAGFRVRTYDGIPLVISTNMPDDLTWSGTAITAFSGGSTTALLILNTRYCWIEELTPMTVMPLAKTTSQNDNVDMFWDGVGVYSNTLGGAILGGIAGS